MINLCIRICYNGISPGINCLSTKKKKKKVFVVVVTFCFYRWEFFFKLIKIEEEKKKKREIVILCCSTIFQRVFSYNLYFLKVGEKKKKNFKSEIKKKNQGKSRCFLKPELR